MMFLCFTILVFMVLSLVYLFSEVFFHQRTFLSGFGGFLLIEHFGLDAFQENKAHWTQTLWVGFFRGGFCVSRRQRSKCVMFVYEVAHLVCLGKYRHWLKTSHKSFEESNREKMFIRPSRKLTWEISKNAVKFKSDSGNRFLFAENC